MAEPDNPNNFRGVRNQKTTPDDSYAKTGGKTTILSGISGASLSYLPGDVVDTAYQLTKLLGRGGMGAVFACRHLVLDKEYALKLLSGHELSGQAWSRFQIEAKALARLNHPGIVGIYNMGIDKEQCPYYVMDLLSGEALNSFIDRVGPLPVSEALEIFITVADALASAHLQGIIHRDIKPSNLMLEQTNQNRVTGVKLVDFGIARLSKQGVVVQSQTATGLIFGTPFYMSPEQCDGAKVDERSDVYSLGCTLFETLTGQPPFVGDSAFQTFMLHQTQEPPSLASRAPQGDFPKSLELAIAKMLRKSPADRYQAMTQLTHDLERIKAGKPIMADGLSNTLAPSVSASVKALPSLRTKTNADRIYDNVDNTDEDDQLAQSVSQSSIKKLAIVVSMLCVVGAGWLLQATFFSHSPKAAHAQKNPSSVSNSDKDAAESDPLAKYLTHSKRADSKVFSQPLMATLKGFGAADTELEDLTVERFTDLSYDEDTAKKMFASSAKNRSWSNTPYLSGGVFHFPRDIFAGAISIDNAKPLLTKGDIPCPKNASAFLYLITPTRETPSLLNKFGPQDLTGIAMVFVQPAVAIAIVSKWTRLKDLMFFNPILKAMPDHSENWDESKITDAELPSLEKFTGLRSLGLCHSVTGPAILKMALLTKLEAIRLKRIQKFEPLLRALPRLTNLKEVYLMHQETTDAQLKFLAQMKDLEKLSILRSRLTLDCVPYLKTMKTLKELHLDRNDWTDEQKEEVQKQLLPCRVIFEKVADCQYWSVLGE